MTASLRKLLDMTWVALAESRDVSIAVDEKSFSFFTAPVPTPNPLRGREMEEPLLPTQEQLPPVEADRAQVEQGRLKKLLPHPITLPQKEITKKEIEGTGKYMNVSEETLYKESELSSTKGRWTLFIEITEKTPHEEFINSVISAISSRLGIHLSPYSHRKTPLPLHIPLLVQECDHFLIIMDQHLESATKKSLEAVPSFSPSTNISPIPFSTLGTVHGRPIHGLTLHAHSHEDSSFKRQLWNALQRLAHTCFTDEG